MYGLLYTYVTFHAEWGIRRPNSMSQILAKIETRSDVYPILSSCLFSRDASNYACVGFCRQMPSSLRMVAPASGAHESDPKFGIPSIAWRILASGIFLGMPPGSATYTGVGICTHLSRCIWMGAGAQGPRVDFLGKIEVSSDA